MNVCLEVGLFQKPQDIGWSEVVLRSLLEILAFANLAYIKTRHPPSLYASGVYYQAEPRGQENWCGIAAVMRQGFGDCEDLSAWRVAELRAGRWNPTTRRWVGGEKAGFVLKKKVKRGGFLLYHIQVRRADGRIEDPSRRLGM